MAISSATNRITSPGYGYDNAGNLKQIPGATLTFDGASRVASFLGESLVQYHYDGNGMRVIKDPSLHDSTVYLFSGSQLLAEYDAGASPLLPNKEYIYQEGRLLGWYDGQAHFELLDHLSSRGTVDAGGTLEERGHFPFGEEWYSTGSNETAQTFTSYTRDDESELDYAGARFYSPHLGRFMSADPVLDSSASPQRLARYTYVLNDPIDLVDPSGAVAACWTIVTWKVTNFFNATTGQLIGQTRQRVNTTSNCEEKRKREDERAAKCAGTQEYLQTKILIDTAQKAADRLERPWWGAISYVVPRVMQARCEEFAGAIMSAVNELNLSCYTAGIVYSEEKNRLGNPWHVAVVAYRPGAHPSTGLILDAWPHGKLKVSTAENWYAGFGDFRPELSRIEPEFGDDLCPMTPVMLPR